MRIARWAPEQVRVGRGRARRPWAFGALFALLWLGSMGPLGSAIAAGTAAEAALLSHELRLRAAVDAEDRRALEALSAAPTPDAVRARALWELYRGAQAPLAPGDRLRLQGALSDPSPGVRRAALRAIGAAGERLLEREALKRAAEDPEPEVRIEALRAIRRWSRQGHLYFLEQALGADDVRVRVEALRNLAGVSYREVAPVLVNRVRGFAQARGDPFVRSEALEVLQAWDRSEWGLLEDAIADRTAPDSLRVRALELGDEVGDGAQREAVWLQVLDADPSFRIAWECFRRLAGSGTGRAEAAAPVARLLARTPHKNAATEEMAAFLVSRGYRVEFRSGSWNVGAR